MDRLCGKSMSCLNFGGNTGHSIPDMVSSVLMRKEASPLLKGLAIPFLTHLRTLFSFFVVRLHHWFMVNKVSTRTQGPSLQNSSSARWPLTEWATGLIYYQGRILLFHLLNITSVYAQLSSLSWMLCMAAQSCHVWAAFACSTPF